MAARISSFLALLAATATTLAAPSPSFSHISTHGKRAVATDGQLVESFHPLAKYETFGDGIALPELAAVRRDNTPAFVSAASSFLQSQHGLAPGSFQSHSSAVAETATHVWFKQLINGLPTVNSVANVAISTNNKVVAAGVNFVTPSSISSATPKISTADAIAAAEKQLGGTHVDVPVTTEYFINSSNQAVLVHVVQVQTPNVTHWYQAYVDAATGNVVGAIDFVAKSTYKVLPIQLEYPSSGLQTLADPQDTIASPNGWHTVGGVTNKFTAGNNAIAYKGSQSATQAESSAGQYVFAWSDASAPTTTANVGAAKTNAFYVVNSIHDISYRYGFTEALFNFQNDNFSKGGKGNDRVLISVQDAGGTDNANFATPPDGQSGQMNMYIWDITSPNRDGDMENDIVSHENTHGITNRMTGGGTGACLTTTEAGGMGEGWSDSMAFWLEQTSATIKDYSLGEYVYGQNIRSHPYSTSKTTNPLTYHSIASLNEVHDIGEVWANTLFNVYAQLVTDFGFSTTARTNPDTTEGNVVFMHLFLDALPLQPCNPTLPTGRDAWIQADTNRYGGAHICSLWKAFASRGLGQGAANHVDSSTIPASCSGTSTTAVPTSTTKTTSTTSVSSTSKTTSSTPTSTPTGTVTIPSRSTFSVLTSSGSPVGGILSFGTWSVQTPGTMTAAVSGSGYTITSSKGSCGVSGTTFSCGNGFSSVFTGVQSGSNILLAYQGSTAFSGSAIPSGTDQITVSVGNVAAQGFQIIINAA